MIKKILPAAEFGVTKDRVDQDAWVVISKLQANGFDAFIVGGAVRDLLLGIQPKDFDIVTDATPEEVRKVFKRNSVIIGRRFKIVHVIFDHFDPERLINNRPAFSRHVIEVSTYRSKKVSDEHVSAHGKIMVDNDYGTQEEDSTRRDFTVNALYYDPVTETIIDYHLGINDIVNKNLRIIGDPLTRYIEDPVRVLRAIRLASKLGMTIDPDTLAPIAQVKKLLVNEHKWRLHEEMLKILLSGHALKCISYLQYVKLPKEVFVIFDKLFFTSKPDEMSLKVLEMTDSRIQDGNDVSMSFILAGILWNRVNHKWQTLKKRAKAAKPRRQHLVDAIVSFRDFAVFAGISRNIYTKISDVWLMQFDFDYPIPSKVVKLLKNRRFRQGLHLFTLRGSFGQSDSTLCEWWIKISETTDMAQRDDLLNELALTKSLPGKSSDIEPSSDL